MTEKDNHIEKINQELTGKTKECENDKEIFLKTLIVMGRNQEKSDWYQKENSDFDPSYGYFTAQKKQEILLTKEYQKSKLRYSKYIIVDGNDKRITIFKKPKILSDKHNAIYIVGKKEFSIFHTEPTSMPHNFYRIEYIQYKSNLIEPLLCAVDVNTIKFTLCGQALSDFKFNNQIQMQVGMNKTKVTDYIQQKNLFMLNKIKEQDHHISILYEVYVEMIKEAEKVLFRRNNCQEVFNVTLRKEKAEHLSPL